MDYLKGKGAQINTANSFSKYYLEAEDFDGLDEPLLVAKPTIQVIHESPKKIVSFNKSNDIPFEASINPYQGCEHGCVYCYARKSHEYWGYSAGLDFETKIIVKKSAPTLLEKTFQSKSWKPQTIMLSGNTDCYQPLEAKYQLTRQILEVCLKYRNPVAIITKNSLIKRDVDILEEMSKLNLVSVMFSINSLDEDLRRKLEPRTATSFSKFKVMNQLANLGVKVGVMCAPVIPALNHHEIPNILQKASESGAKYAGYTVVRLNGQIGEVFKDWLGKNFPDRKEKVWNQVCSMHGGNVNDSRVGKRQVGDGKIAESIKMLFKISKLKYFNEEHHSPLSKHHFRRDCTPTLFD